MQDLSAHVLELIRLAATDLPPDVQKSLEEAVAREAPGSAARIPAPRYFMFIFPPAGASASCAHR
jgi:hypothetical protein